MSPRSLMMAGAAVALLLAGPAAAQSAADAIHRRVLVLDGGRIVEDGAPDDLVAQNGRYAALHRAWIDSLA